MLELINNNWEMLVAILALLISLQANIRARRSEDRADRLLVSIKKTELLQEFDRQHTLLRRLEFVVESELLQFQMCPQIEEIQPGEKERLENNLTGLTKLLEFCAKGREEAENIGAQYDPAQVDVKLADLRRVSVHLETDIEHETTLLRGKENLVSTAPEFKSNDY